jgi:hypothetical protein
VRHFTSPCALPRSQLTAAQFREVRTTIDMNRRDRRTTTAPPLPGCVSPPAVQIFRASLSPVSPARWTGLSTNIVEVCLPRRGAARRSRWLQLSFCSNTLFAYIPSASLPLPFPFFSPHRPKPRTQTVYNLRVKHRQAAAMVSSSALRRMYLLFAALAALASRAAAATYYGTYDECINDGCVTFSLSLALCVLTSNLRILALCLPADRRLHRRRFMYRRGYYNPDTGACIFPGQPGYIAPLAEPAA